MSSALAIDDSETNDKNDMNFGANGCVACLFRACTRRLFAWGPLPGGRGGGRPPQILEENFSIHSAPQILAGFVVKCFNSIIKILELRE